MKRCEMIKNKDYFNSIIKNGKFVKDANFVIYFVHNKEEFQPDVLLPPFFGLKSKQHALLRPFPGFR